MLQRSPGKALSDGSLGYSGWKCQMVLFPGSDVLRKKTEKNMNCLTSIYRSP